MAAMVTKKDLLVDGFDLGVTPSSPDFKRFCSAWINNRFPDADDTVKKNFVNNFTSTAKNKWTKKHKYTKRTILADDYFKASIVFKAPEPAEPKQKGTILFLSHESKQIDVISQCLLIVVCVL